MLSRIRKRTNLVEMVKKAKWLKNVKKAFSPDSKKLKHQSAECQNSVISYPVLVATSRSYPPQFEVRVDEVNYKQNKNLCPPSSSDEDDPVDSPPSATEINVHQPLVYRFAGKSEKESAAILIQTMFRGYLARRESRAMMGLARLKLLMEGSVIKRQAANTLKCMQTLTRVQSQIRSRRIRMFEENQARHKHLLHKHAKELGGLKNGGNWNDSNQSKEQVEASLLHKYEATMRRERALAYAFTHQQNLKSNSKSAIPMFMVHSNPTWGWSWLERWMAGKPWESPEKELNNNIENSSVKSHGEETAKSSNRNKLNNLTQPNITSSTTRNTIKKKPNPSSIKSKTTDENSKSSVTNRKHSVARSSVSDDESLASSNARRRNMVPTKSARSKLKAHSSSGTTTEENRVPPRRLSNSASPAPKPRRTSAPPKVESCVLKAARTP